MFLLLAGCGGGLDSQASDRRPSVLACTARLGGALPDPGCTPGVTNPDVTQSTIRTTICKVGWTATVRPSLYASLKLKRLVMKQYGRTDFHDVEADHLISLELGGAPADPRNIWPESWHVLVNGKDLGSLTKDKLENRLKRSVCRGTMTLAAARLLISQDWTVAAG